jgi:hypothetical protein
LETQKLQQDAALAQQKIQSSEMIADEKADIARSRLDQQERAQYAAENRQEQQGGQ